MEELPLLPGQHTRWAHSGCTSSSGARAAPGLGFALPQPPTPSRALASTWRPRPGNPAASMAALAHSPRGGAGGSSARARTYPHRCRPAPRPPPLLTSPRAAAVPGAGPCLAPPQLGRAGTATPLPPAPPGPAAVPSAAVLPSYEPPSPGPPVPPGHGRAELRHCRARPRGGLSHSGRALGRPQAGRGHNSP